ncbi:MAG TPA: DUF1345 domain-containing protein, partial [Segetibacter sp.]
MSTVHSKTIRLLESRRYRLYASILIACIVFFIFSAETSAAIRFMSAWIAFATANLIAAWYVMLSAHPKKVKQIADSEDSSGVGIFLFVLSAAFISLFAVIFLLTANSGELKQKESAHFILSFSSV